MNKPAPVLSARELSRRFGTRIALRDVSLEAHPGETVALIGPNGAGKTTLLSILAGTLRASAGTLQIAGRAGWVPQEPAVYSKLTVAENLRLFARLERLADPEAVLDAMLTHADLHERADEQLVRLSAGNRQRVNIAVGLLADPALLLLDEPSAALDPRQRERMWEFLKARVAQGTSILFSTHELGEAARHADRVLLLVEGVMRFAGRPEELPTAAASGAAAAGTAASTKSPSPDFERAFLAIVEQAEGRS